VRFAERASVDPAKLIALIESDKQRYRLDGPFKLRFSWRVEAPEQRVGAVEKLLKRLAPRDVESVAA
jgi:transcription-repair coupling factor (superfamily II helicase)